MNLHELEEYELPDCDIETIADTPECPECGAETDDDGALCDSCAEDTAEEAEDDCWLEEIPF